MSRRLLPRVCLLLLALLGGLAVALLSPAPEAGGAPAPFTSARVITNSLGMKLARIPPGKFLMGTPATELQRETQEGPQHEVAITRGFYMGIYEVTQEEWEKVMGNNPSNFRPGGSYATRVQGINHKRLPVENVHWQDAKDFCKKLSDLPAEKSARRSYRLPTEAEWEYACRAGVKEYAPFAFGKSLSSTQANFNGSQAYGTAVRGPNLDRTSIVGSYKPNAWGLYDMHGNVWEWCEDHPEEYGNRKAPVRDPRGAATGSQRIFRGGSWINSGAWCRSGMRYRATPTAKNYLIGFRVVCVPAAGVH
jgi:formylglycine-generating enzyme required for sulfatase activity